MASNADFSRYFRAQSNYFTITHYAGNVSYNEKIMFYKFYHVAIKA